VIATEGVEKAGWNGSNQRFCTITLKCSKSEIRPQAGTDDLNRISRTPLALMNDKLLDVPWFKDGQIDGTVFKYAR
jgi:hypothetical protein